MCACHAGVAGQIGALTALCPAATLRLRLLCLPQKTILQAAQQARSGQQPVQHGRIAVKCMASLLVALPHFNYTSDLLQALVPHMAHKDQQTR